jgi:AcrR family transcriptional regulator
MTTKRENKKQLLLNTAKKLLSTGELDAVTLDAVAKAANVSKGGLLYHFPTKEALLTELATSIFIDMHDRFLAIAEKFPASDYRYTAALIEVTEEDLIANAELNVALLAQTAISQKLQEQLSAIYQQMLAHLEKDSLAAPKKQIVRFALDGLYYNQLFKIAPITKQELQTMLDNLKQFIKEE